LVLMPILYWYRAENQQQHASIDKLTADLDTANKSISKLKQDNKEGEKTQDNQKSEFEKSAHEEKMALLTTEQAKNDAKAKNDRLKTKLAENETTIQTLNRQLN